MPLWLVATLAAATFQAARFLLMKRLALGGLSPAATTFARFVWAPPAIALGLAGWWAAGGAHPPRPLPGFWAWAAGGAASQILATTLVMVLLARRAFAVGIALSKTAVLLTVLAGWAALGEAVGPGTFAAMVVGTGGVIVLSVPAGRGLRPDLGAAACGLGAGAFFAASAVSYRAASLAVPAAEPVLRAATTLVLVTTLQTAMLAAWLAWRDRAGLVAVVRGWRATVPVGILSLLGSMGWFTAYTLQNAGIVNAVGQIELLLSMAISTALLGERLTRREVAGIALVGSGVAAVVLTV